jgi:hypothetical protein
MNVAEVVDQKSHVEAARKSGVYWDDQWCRPVIGADRIDD